MFRNSVRCLVFGILVLTVVIDRRGKIAATGSLDEVLSKAHELAAQAR